MWCIGCMPDNIASIENKELGLSVRNKLNALITRNNSADARYLRSSENLGDLTDVVAAREALEIDRMALRTPVTVPASRTAAGSPGEYAIDSVGGLLWVYTGDGSTHAWTTYVATNADGELVANIALADLTGLTPAEHVIGHVGGEFRQGDGVTEGGVPVVPPFAGEQVGTALIVGDKGGNTRGANAVNIQPSRTNVANVASGDRAVVIGADAKGSGQDEVIIGDGASGDTLQGGVAVGGGAQVTGDTDGLGGVAVGYQALMDGVEGVAIGGKSSAPFGGSGGSAEAGSYGTAVGAGAKALNAGDTSVGNSAQAAGGNTIAIGFATKNTVSGATEIGGHVGGRGGSLRTHSDGQAAFTIRNSASAPTDGGTTVGSEPNGTLPRGMFCLQRNGAAITLYHNDASGSITSLSLGNLA